jgi:hypothetical protein
VEKDLRDKTHHQLQAFGNSNIPETTEFDIIIVFVNSQLLKYETDTKTHTLVSTAQMRDRFMVDTK